MTKNNKATQIEFEEIELFSHLIYLLSKRIQLVLISTSEGLSNYRETYGNYVLHVFLYIRRY